jgi:hypothetical protein
MKNHKAATPQAMLVMTTMLTSISANLPTTADIKFIDIWMLFSLTIPVMEILLHTVEDHVVRRGRGEFGPPPRPAGRRPSVSLLR